MSHEEYNIELYESDSLYEEAQVITRLIVQLVDSGITGRIAIITNQQDLLLRLLQMIFAHRGISAYNHTSATLADTHLPALLDGVWQLVINGNGNLQAISKIMCNQLVSIYDEAELLEAVENVRKMLAQHPGQYYTIAQAHLQVAALITDNSPITLAITQLQAKLVNLSRSASIEYMQWLLEQLATQPLPSQDKVNGAQVHIMQFAVARTVERPEVAIFPAFNEDALYAAIVKKGAKRMSFEERTRELGSLEHEVSSYINQMRVIFTRARANNGVQTRPARLLRKLALSGLRSNTMPVPYLGNGINQQPPAYHVPVNMRPRRLSASAIELLMHDPYSFYIRYILKLYPQEQPITYSMQHFGIALHKSLAALGVQADMPCRAYIAAVIAKFKEYFTDCQDVSGSHIMQAWEMQLEPILSRLHAFNKHLFAMLHESKQEHKCELSISTATGTAQVFAISDRVDIYKSPYRVAIYDYKTGAIPIAAEVKRGLFPQLLIAGLHYLVVDTLANSGVAERQAIQIGYIPLSHYIADDVVRWIKADLWEAQNGLEALIEAYLHQDTTFSAVADFEGKVRGYGHLRRDQEWA